MLLRGFDRKRVRGITEMDRRESSTLATETKCPGTPPRNPAVEPDGRRTSAYRRTEIDPGSSKETTECTVVKSGTISIGMEFSHASAFVTSGLTAPSASSFSAATQSPVASTVSSSWSRERTASLIFAIFTLNVPSEWNRILGWVRVRSAQVC